MKDLKLRFWKYFSKYWPYLLIIFLTILFFWKVIFRGLVPIPADITVGLYYPWLDYKWGYEVGVPVKNNLPSDIVSVHLPFRLFAAEQIRNGNLPLWNNLVLSGTPLIANFQSAVFYPLNLLLFFTSTIKTWTIQVMLQPLLSAIFTYMLLRNWKLSKISSIFGAIAFAFTGFLLVWQQYNIHGHVAYWLPATLLIIDKFLKKPKVQYLVLVSIFVTLSILAGYPQMVLYEGLAVGIYLLFKRNEKYWIKYIFVIVIFATLGLALSSIQILPSLELLNISNRPYDSQTIAIANQGFLPFKHLIGFFAPDYFGNPATGNWWGVGFYDNFTAYPSIVALTMAAIGIFMYWKKQEVRYLSVLLVISLALALKSPLSLFLFKTNILGFQAAVASRALFLSGFSIALLSAFGIEAIQKEVWNKKIFRVTYLSWVALIGTGIGTLTALFIFKSFKSTMITFPEAIVILTEQEKHLVVGLRNLILPIALIFATSCFLLIIKTKFLRNLAICALFLFLVFDLFRFGHKYLTFTKESLLFPKTPVIDFLIGKLQAGEPFRVEGGDVIPMNMLAPFGIETMEGYDAYYSLEYAKFLSKINGGDPTQPLGRYGEINKYDSKFIDYGNVKYILALKRDKIAVPSPNGVPDYIFDLEKLTPVFEDGTVVVFENKNVRERAFFESGTGNIQFIEYLPNYKKLTVNARADSNIVLSETYYPGWIAFVDGVETDIYLSKDVYKSVALSEGEHIVEFIYSPESFKIGKWVSFATLLVLIAILIYGQTLKKRLGVARKSSS